MLRDRPMTQEQGDRLQAEFEKVWKGSPAVRRMSNAQINALIRRMAETLAADDGEPPPIIVEC
jgi:hypothetical protein